MLAQPLTTPRRAGHGALSAVQRFPTCPGLSSALGRDRRSFATRRWCAAPPSASRDTASRAAATETTTTSTPSPAEQPDLRGLSYSQQYDVLYRTQPLNVKQMVPKPDKAAQAKEPGSWQVFGTDIYAVKKTNQWFGREWHPMDLLYLGFLGGVHLVALAAPFTFTWPMFWLFMAGYFVTGCLGITLSFHRQLSHRSFQTPKWLEYALAYCGVLSVQGDPIEWVSSHRYHHLHCDTPLDPHSPYEGFWWSHAGWLLNNQATMARVYNRSNATDLESQAYYRWLRDTYVWHVVAQFAVLWALGGFPAVVWGGALRLVLVYHITWAVNSVAHVWGTQTYDTGDLSRDNWLIGILAWGEGWHNGHHAFEFSARHGLEPHQVDVTWGIIWALQKLGLATNVKLPTKKQKAKLRFPSDKPISA